MVLNKIKYNYNLKVIEDLFAENKYDEIVSTLQQFKQNPYYTNLVNLISNKYLTLNKHFSFFRKKFIWIASFDQNEIDPINNFLDFYLKKNFKDSFHIGEYKELISNTLVNTKGNKFPNLIDFENIVNNSFFFQLLALLDTEKEIIFSNTNAAFFEAPNKKFLIYPQSTLCSFYIIRNPFKLYERYKKKCGSTQEALNEISNNDIKSNENKNLDYLLNENRQSWNVNAQSWLNNNVQNTYRGRIIEYEKFINEPQDTLMDIIYHLKQSGLELDINFEDIEIFIDKNYPQKEESYSEPLSNKEIKMVKNSLDPNILDKFNYK